MTRPRRTKSRSPIAPPRPALLAACALALLCLLSQSSQATELSREYEQQLAKAAKEYPLVVAALLHAQEDTARFAELAITLNPEVVRQSNARAETCAFSCRLRPNQPHCASCPQGPVTDRPSCGSCRAVCHPAAVLGTQVDCADCMIQRGDNGCL